MEIEAGGNVDIEGDVTEGNKVLAGRDVRGTDSGGKKKPKKWLVKFAVAAGLQGPLMVVADWLQEMFG